MSLYRLHSLELDLSKASALLKIPKEEALLQKAHDGLKAKFKNKSVGFFDFPQSVTSLELNAIKDCASELRKKYNAAIICGIGGSHLGAAALLEALRTENDEDQFPILWLNNVDPHAIERAESFVKKYKAATLLISKSGNTTETLAGFFHLSRHLDKHGIVAITDEQSGELRRLAQKEGWKSFPVPGNIGGRFSVLTAVGLLPAALGGLSIDSLIKGASAMAGELKDRPVAENAAFAYAQLAFRADQEKHTVQYLMPYHSNLKLLGDWYVQLWAESLGKKNASLHSVGPTFVGALGTRDQHSLLQLFKEGPNNKVIGFVDIAPNAKRIPIGEPNIDSPNFRYLTNHSFGDVTTKALIATQQSLNSAGVPTYVLKLNSLDESSLGAFFLFQEYACAIAGELYGIDAFGQPGVEEAKKLLRASL